MTDDTYEFRTVSGTVRITGPAVERMQYMYNKLKQCQDCALTYLNLVTYGRLYRPYRRGKNRCPYCGYLRRHHNHD